MSIEKEIQLILALIKDYGVFSFINNFQKSNNLSETCLSSNLKIKTSINNAESVTDTAHTRLTDKYNKTDHIDCNTESIAIAKPNSAMNFSEDVQNDIKKQIQNVGSLDELKNLLINFNGCSLAKTATNTVFGEGNPAADVLMIGEAPGAEEDMQGKPFVGRSGQLLKQALASINVYREDIFTTNTVFWRPPGNRNPTPLEVDICRPFIQKMISIIKPKMILVVGRIAAISLLKQDLPLSAWRGKWVKASWGFNNDIVEDIHVRVLYHPAYLLRSPKNKKTFWLDLMEISSKMANLGLSK